jgi:hypothetical protein
MRLHTHPQFATRIDIVKSQLASVDTHGTQCRPSHTNRSMGSSEAERCPTDPRSTRRVLASHIREVPFTTPSHVGETMRGSMTVPPLRYHAPKPVSPRRRPPLDT